MKKVILFALVLGFTIPAVSQDSQQQLLNLLDTIYAPINVVGSQGYGDDANAYNFFIDVGEVIGLGVGSFIYFGSDYHLKVISQKDLILKRTEASAITSSDVKNILAQIPENGLKSKDRIYLVGFSKKTGSHMEHSDPMYIPVGQSNKTTTERPDFIEIKDEICLTLYSKDSLKR